MGEFAISAAIMLAVLAVVILVDSVLPDPAPPHYIDLSTPLSWGAAALLGVFRSDRSSSRMATALGVATAAALVAGASILSLLPLTEIWSLPRFTLALSNTFLASFGATFIAASLAATSGASPVSETVPIDEGPNHGRPVV